MLVQRSAIAALLIGSASGQAEEIPRAAPESVGLSSEALEAVTRKLQEHVDAGDIAGVVAAVMREGKLVYQEALGHISAFAS